MNTFDERIGIPGKKGCEDLSISKEQKLDTKSHHNAMSTMKPDRKAKEWFKRPPYSIKRSGASGTSGNDGERTEEGIS